MTTGIDFQNSSFPVCFKRSIVMFLFALVLAATGNAQIDDYVFKALTVNGKVKLNKKEMKTGMELSSKKDRLKLAENSSVKLLHWTGKTLTVQKPGLYTITD